MKVLIDELGQKRIVVGVAAAASFLGLQAASGAIGAFQIKAFLKVALDVYLFLAFWQMFVFDLHLKNTTSWKVLKRSFFATFKQRFRHLVKHHHWLHFQNYLILPAIIFWSAVGLLYLNPFETPVKQSVIILTSAALTICFWYLKTVFYRHQEAGQLKRSLIFLTKFFAAYLGFAAVLGLTRHFGFSLWIAGLSVFSLTYLLLHQAFFQHHFLGFHTVKLLLYSGSALGFLALIVFEFWNVNYFSGALVLSGVYNTIWGIFHHKFIDRNLSREIVYEYLAVLFTILVIVIGTTNFAERI